MAAPNFVQIGGQQGNPRLAAASQIADVRGGRRAQQQALLMQMLQQQSQSQQQNKQLEVMLLMEQLRGQRQERQFGSELKFQERVEENAKNRAIADRELNRVLADERNKTILEGANIQNKVGLDANDISRMFQQFQINQIETSEKKGDIADVATGQIEQSRAEGGFRAKEVEAKAGTSMSDLAQAFNAAPKTLFNTAKNAQNDQGFFNTAFDNIGKMAANLVTPGQRAMTKPEKIATRDMLRKIKSTALGHSKFVGPATDKADEAKAGAMLAGILESGILSEGDLFRFEEFRDSPMGVRILKAYNNAARPFNQELLDVQRSQLTEETGIRRAGRAARIQAADLSSGQILQRLMGPQQEPVLGPVAPGFGENNGQGLSPGELERALLGG